MFSCKKEGFLHLRDEVISLFPMLHIDIKSKGKACLL